LAERKFLFLHADGYHEEQTTGDTATFGGLTLGGNIAMGNNKITGLASGTNPTDAVNKSQLDGMAVGLSWKDPAQVLRIKSDADQSGTPPTAGSAGEAWVVDNWGVGYTDGDIVEWDGDSWDVVVAGVTGEPPDGTRVVVIETGAAGAFAGHEEDIATYGEYLNAWTFVDAEDGDALLIIGNGGVYENQGYTFDGSNWVQFTGLGLITAGDGLVKVGNVISVDLADTNPGLEFVSNDLAAKVNTSYGLSIGASGIAVDIVAAGSGTGGLEFSTGDLQVKTDGAHGIILTTTGVEVEVNTAEGIDVDASGIYAKLLAAGGLEFAPYGEIQIKLDNTPDTLDVDADGLKVVGLPSLFKINDTAVGATITAANLDDLTDGSDASALHFHTSQSVPFVAAENIAKADPVYMTATANNIGKADAGADAKRWVVGIAAAAISSAATGNVITSGVLTGALTGATAGARYWLADTGGLTATRPTGNKSIVLVGIAKNATDLIVKIQDYGKAS
jgi:hypothetical protein